MPNNKNNSLFLFIMGLFTGLVFIPLIQEGLNVIYTWIQAAIIKPSKIVAKGNIDLAEMQSSAEPVNSSVIGFQYCPDEEEYDDEFEDKQV